MAKEIQVFIAGQPRAKSRPRFSVRCGHAVAYKPRQDEVYETLIRNEFMAAAKEVGWMADENPVSVSIHVVQPIAKSISKKEREKILQGQSLLTKKADVDNYAKIALDAINGYAWLDDKQVTELHVYKAMGEKPSMTIRIYRRV